MSAKKTEILFEDLTAMADKWTSAMSGKEFSQNYMTLLDLLNGHGADEQHPNNVRAKGPDVHGSQMFLQMLGDIMINADDFHRAVKKVTSSPVIEDNKKAQIELIKMLKKARMIKRLVMSISDDIEKFQVDVPGE
tara:strand:+ start:247 stop:651 length:405 start_codon:yes stop_codon:yes gene_type:complete